MAVIFIQRANLSYQVDRRFCLSDKMPLAHFVPFSRPFDGKPLCNFTADH